MNIFKALSQGDGSINETNVTSFFSFICNETNNFSPSFLILFLEEINKKLNQKIFDFQGSNHRQKVEFFKSNYTYSAQPEFRLQVDNQIQDVNILITISDKNDGSELYFLLIENKIKKSSCNEGQCLLQYELFKKNEDYQTETPVISVLISPDDQIFETMVNFIKQKNSLSVWFKWETQSEKSLVEIFKTLIQLENNGEIAPIENNTLYILKSFIDFISTELGKKDKRGNYNYSIAGAEVIDQCEFFREGKLYLLKRYENKMIRIFNEDNVIQDVPVKPILREIIENYDLNIPLERKSGKLKNTQELGKDVITEINKNLY